MPAHDNLPSLRDYRLTRSPSIAYAAGGESIPLCRALTLGNLFDWELAGLASFVDRSDRLL